MTIFRKLPVLTIVAVLLGLTLSGCGDKESTGDQAGTTSGKGDDVALSAANFSQVLADAQTEAKSSHVDMTIGVGGQSIKAQGDVAVGSTPANSAMKLTMDMGSSMKFEMRLVDQVFYMNMGQMTGGKYLKIDLNDENNPLAEQYGQIMEQMDPAKQLDELKVAVSSFEKKGEPKTIDGVKAQPYVVKVDTSKMTAFKELPDTAAGQIPDTIVYTMYIGPDQLLRRLEFELAGSKSTMDYSKWGEPVDIKAPAAGEITDKGFGDLAGLAPAA